MFQDNTLFKTGINSVCVLCPVQGVAIKCVHANEIYDNALIHKLYYKAQAECN